MRIRQVSSLPPPWLRLVGASFLAMALGGAIPSSAYADRHVHRAGATAHKGKDIPVARHPADRPAHTGVDTAHRARVPHARRERHRPSSRLALLPEQKVHARFAHTLARPSHRHHAGTPHGQISGQVTPAVIHAVLAAGREAQADPAILLAIAWQESRFDSAARNRHSSARGLLQFTTVTWLTMIRDFGARHGLAGYAAAIKTGADGRLTVRSRSIRRAILALRDNPRLEAIMAAERLAAEREALAAAIGRPVTPADLYLLYLLGPTGAKTFLAELARNPSRSALDVVGDAAQPNLGLFVLNGRPLSVAETYSRIEGVLTEQATRHAPLFSPPPAEPAALE